MADATAPVQLVLSKVMKRLTKTVMTINTRQDRRYCSLGPPLSQTIVSTATKLSRQEIGNDTSRNLRLTSADVIATTVAPTIIRLSR